MNIEVYDYQKDEIDDDWLNWASLWWTDWEEAGIESCYLAISDDEVVGFQTVNCDGLCCAIEVHPDYQGQSVAKALIETSGVWKPEQNENLEFWERMEDLYA